MEGHEADLVDSTTGARISDGHATRFWVDPNQLQPWNCGTNLWPVAVMAMQSHRHCCTRVQGSLSNSFGTHDCKGCETSPRVHEDNHIERHLPTHWW